MDRSEYLKSWRQANPERLKTYARKHQLLKYGLSIEDYVYLWDAQEGLCKICGQPERVNDRTGSKRDYLSVDHEHTTGIVRGLLCHHCNAALGHAEDSPILLRKMADYIEGKV